MKNIIKLVGGGFLLVVSSGLYADQVILDDLIVDGSVCAGMDCVNGESFGFDTIRLKENNLRIRAVDTSSTSSFPSRDWQITFNDSANGGANKFSIDDIDGGRTPLTIEAGAPSHSLYVDDGGRLGLGTSTPVVDVHVKSGNTPTMRLEQDGSSGFTPQTWDVAGNEANFFIRDASNGSTLPFRIFPGAPSNALTIEASGQIGIGTTSPDEELDIEGSDDGGEVKIKIQNLADGGNQWALSVTDGGSSTNESEFRISKQGTGGPELTINQHSDGNGTSDATLVVLGSIEATNVAFTSSREKKTDFEAVDASEILDGVAALEMSSWRYKQGSPGKHIGPIAEDFEEVFGLGSSGKTISVVDANGIALAAIQGLYAEVQKRDQMIEELAGQLVHLQGQMDSMLKSVEYQPTL